MTYVWLGLGLLLLAAGAELLIGGAVAAARRLKVSPLLIGLVLVGYGTSMPELVTSVKGTLAGSPGIAVGNVVGSNIVNILMILGLAALLRPVHADPAAFRRDGAMLMLATLAVVGVCLLGTIGRLAGAGMLTALVIYGVVCYRMERAHPDAGAAVHEAEAGTALLSPRTPAVAAIYIAAGFGGLIFGASLLVDSAILIARAAGISEVVIGLTIVAAGTSLPELAATVSAALRGQSDVAFGNVVGSNIFNALFILGAAALVQPLAVPVEVARFDIWVMLGTAVLLVLFTMSGWRVNRWEGAAFVSAYAVYVWVLLSPVARATLGLD